MKWMFIAATVLVTSAVAGGANASMCTNECDHNYSICTAQNGGSAPPSCMHAWMQCKKACTAPKGAMTPKPKH